MCKEKFRSIYPSTAGIMQYFGVYLGIFPKVLSNLKNYLDVLHECLDITVMVAKLRMVFDLLPLWKFWAFLFHFVVSFPYKRELFNFSM